MVVNATIHFHGQASPVGVWSFLRLPPNPSRGKKRKKEKKKNMIRLGESLNGWRQRRVDELRQLAVSFRDESERIARKADSSIRAIVENFNIPLSEHL